MLEMIDVSKVYWNSEGREINALSGLNLEIDDNEFVCILGASGCGKTTTLRLAAGLDIPTGGKILIDAKEINGPDSDRCVVFQKYTLFPWRTVLQNIEFGLEIQKVGKRERRKTAREYLDLVGLAEYSSSYPRELSGGMQQRIAVARALAVNPKLLLMDEPFGALDSRTRELLQIELIKIWEKRRKTVLFVTHSINEAITLGDRVVIMTSKPGRIRSILKLEIPRPRDCNSEPFREYYEKIRDILHGDAGQILPPETRDSNGDKGYHEKRRRTGVDTTASPNSQVS